MKNLNNVGLQGLKCPYRNNEETSFDYCLKECKHPCMSMPILKVLSGSGRTIVENVYHVTEILNPPKIVYLSRNNPFYLYAEDMIWGIFGQAWHMVVENGARKLSHQDFISEKSFSTEIGGVILTGTADLYHVPTKTLTDYKTMKVYTAKRLKEGKWDGNKYLDQINIYRTYLFPEAEHLKLECVIKDWSWMAQDRDNIHTIELIDVPIINREEMVKETEWLIKTHTECQKDPSKVRDCTHEECWFNDNPRSKNYLQPLRCERYCPVSNICKQYKKWKEEYDEVPRGFKQEKSRRTTKKRTATQKVLPEI